MAGNNEQQYDFNVVAPQYDAIPLGDLNGNDGFADTTLTDLREFISDAEKLCIMASVKDETVGAYLVRIKVFKTFAEQVAANSACFIGPNIARPLNVASRAFLGMARVGVFIKCIESFPADSLVDDAIPRVARANEVTVCSVRVAPLATSNGVNTLVTGAADGVDYKIIARPDMDVISRLCTEEATMKQAMTFGAVNTCIAKAALFRHGHHLQDDAQFSRMYDTLEAALGITDIAVAKKLTDFQGRLLSARVFAHPFCGSVVSIIKNGLESTGEQALSLRFNGFGAGWAKVALIHVINMALATDKALRGYLYFKLGADLSKIKALCAKYPKPILPGPHGQYCMIKDAFSPGVGGVPEQAVREFLDQHAKSFHAALVSLGGTLAESRTFMRQAGNVSRDVGLINVMRGRIGDTLSEDAIINAIDDREGVQAVTIKIQAGINLDYSTVPAAGF